MTDYTLANLTQPAPAPKKSRTALYVVLAVVAAFLLAAVAVIVTLLATRPSTSPSTQPAAAATSQANGIARPDPSCVQTNGKDHQDMWNANGWWAGRIDGTEKQMNAFDALAQQLDGHSVSSVWICSPRG